MVEGTVDSTVDSGQWRSLAAAARALGVSEKTVRRRAKAGQLEARQIPSPRGPAWQVRVPSTVPSAGRVASPLDSVQGRHEGTQDQTTALLELVRLVGELQPKAEAAAMWQARAELLADRLTIAESRLLALTTPSGSPVASNLTREPPDPTPEPPKPLPWPIPPHPNVRALALVLAVLLAAGSLVVLLR